MIHTPDKGCPYGTPPPKPLWVLFLQSALYGALCGAVAIAVLWWLTIH